MYFLHSLQLETGSGKDRTTQRGRSSHFLRVLVRPRMGKAQLSGHELECGGGHCSLDCVGAIAPMMKPYCAEGEGPTTANLSLYREGKSCVG